MRTSFPLRLRILQMQAAEHAAPTRQVVFDERPRDPQRRVAIRPEALAEETPLAAIMRDVAYYLRIC